MTELNSKETVERSKKASVKAAEHSDKSLKHAARAAEHAHKAREKAEGRSGGSGAEVPVLKEAEEQAQRVKEEVSKSRDISKKTGEQVRRTARVRGDV